MFGIPKEVMGGFASELTKAFKRARNFDYFDYAENGNAEPLWTLLGYENMPSKELLQAVLVKFAREQVPNSTDSDVLLIAFGLLSGYEDEPDVGNRRRRCVEHSDYFRSKNPTDYKVLINSDSNDVRDGLVKAATERLRKKEDRLLYRLACAVEEIGDLLAYVGQTEIYLTQDKFHTLLLPEPSPLMKVRESVVQPATDVDVDSSALQSAVEPVMRYVSGELTDLIRRLEDLCFQQKQPINDTVLPPQDYGVSDIAAPLHRSNGATANTALPVKAIRAGWGPGRATFTKESRIEYPVFNSRTDNLTLGDERNFVRIAEAGAHGYFRDNINIVPGREYEIYIAFHNNGADELNPTGKVIAQQVRFATVFSSKVSPETGGVVSAIISALNTNPLEIWDSVILSSFQEASLHYKIGSSKIFVDGKANGRILPAAMFSQRGTYLGINELNGIMPAGKRFAGHIIYTLVAELPSYEITVTAKTDGEVFSKNITAAVGQEITYKIHLKNSGNVNMKKVTFRVVLPKEVELVPGSTYLYNASHLGGELLSDLIDKNGYNTGLYGPNTTATVTFKAIVKDSAKNVNSFPSAAYVYHEAGILNDRMLIAIEKSE